ncbi:hypothetical protein EG328_006758 [Venturia inaequalis]|uniref:Uncharacterized protein n=1 Tax=Venturia inaequalis TaxID=5025 RepID=A0A8H3VDY9_VENIN|nr:hypothetical protein EG328_006758 [Venturia inaequalis]KAE9992065.1 hypothetical protein EG327_010277 [Venturia inaequalis]
MDASSGFGAHSSDFVDSNELSLDFDALIRAQINFDMAGRSYQYDDITGDFGDHPEEEQLYDHRVAGAMGAFNNINNSGDLALDFSPAFTGAGAGMDMVDGSDWNSLEDCALHGHFGNHDEEEEMYTQQVISADVEEGLNHQHYNSPPASNEETADLTTTEAQSISNAPSQHPPVAQPITVSEDFVDRVPVSGGERTTGDWENDHDEMAVVLWYLRDGEAQGPRVPLPNHKVMMKDLPPRKLAMYRRSDHSCKDIMRIIQDAPARPTGISNRIQRYFAWEGMESEAKGQGRSLPCQAIRGLMKLSNAKIFYGVRGKVKQGEYEMTEPDDAFQGTYAQSTTRVPLRAPKDVEAWLRKALVDAGIKNFPTFPEFLQRNVDIALHFGLDLMTGNCINEPAQQSPAQATQALAGKAQPRKRAADDDMEATPEVDKKRKIEPTVKRMQDQVHPVQSPMEQPLSQEVQQPVNGTSGEVHGLQMNEHSTPEVHHDSDFSPEFVARSLHDFEQSLYNPYPGQSFDDQQHFGEVDLQYGFPAGGFSTEASEYDSGYASASMVSPDTPFSLQDLNLDNLESLYDPNSSFDWCK